MIYTVRLGILACEPKRAQSAGLQGKGDPEPASQTLSYLFCLH